MFQMVGGLRAGWLLRSGHHREAEDATRFIRITPVHQGELSHDADHQRSPELQPTPQEGSLGGPDLGSLCDIMLKGLALFPLGHPPNDSLFFPINPAENSVLGLVHGTEPRFSCLGKGLPMALDAAQAKCVRGVTSGQP